MYPNFSLNRHIWSAFAEIALVIGWSTVCSLHTCDASDVTVTLAVSPTVFKILS